MESVDNLLAVLQSQRGKELRFEVGQKARLVTDGGSYDLSSAPLTPNDIRTSVGPIVPESTREQLINHPSADFDYDCNGVGTFRVRVVRASGSLAFIFVPAGKPAQTTARSAYQVTQEEYSTHTTQRAAQPEAKAQVRAVAAGAAVGQVRTAHRSPRSVTMDELFRAMCEVGASDLHVSVSMPPLVRKDGEMMPLYESGTAFTAEDTKRLLSSIVPRNNAEEFERRRDSDFAYEISGLARFRANIFMDRKGMGGVFRVIPNDILTVEDLKLSQPVLRLCHLNKGLVIVTGPTGSGKSTTLCALIDYINRNRKDHIITIEDPIEFVHENKKCLINQREVHNHTDSFRDALRAALREDPDIVMIGEMRDLETVAIAIETAETGHLVFGTLHTTTAASTIDRVIDQFPPDRQAQIRIMLSESLRGVISQTLLRRTDGGGRIAAMETLIVNSAVSNLIREAKTFQIPSVMQTQRSMGSVLLNDALIEMCNKKLVSPEEAYMKSVDKTGFEALLRRSNYDTKFVIQAIV